MASFASVLSDIGNALKKAFDKILPLAAAAEPIVDVVLPGVGPLYNSTVAAVASAETAAVAAGQQSGTGPQKLAAVVSAITPTFQQYASQNGLAAPTETVITNYVNAVVASLNAIPAAPAA